MENAFFLAPVESRLVERIKANTIGEQLRIHCEQFPQLEGIKIALVGVAEERGALDNEGCSSGLPAIREAFYDLFPFKGFPEIADLGTIRSGERLDDTFTALAQVQRELIEKGITVVVIGGSQDLTFAQYRGYEQLKKLINLVCIDERFDLGTQMEAPITDESYLSKILTHQPNFLFNYAQLGYQSYYVSQEELELLESLFFETLRLGEFREDPTESEPYIRSADAISFDIRSIKAGDAPGVNNSTPNGFTGDEACRIMRYAGLTDRTSSIGLYNYNPLNDTDMRTAKLIAQMIWYFLEGYAARKQDIPMASNQNYLKYQVNVEDQIVVFYKSVLTDRWWVNVPFPEHRGNRYKRHEMIPCSYKHYVQACKNEMPDVWLRTYQRMM